MRVLRVMYAGVESHVSGCLESCMRVLRVMYPGVESHVSGS